jgi:predicted enzyme related to lactoylglutathione lyase
MKMTDKVFRLYAETEKFESVIAFYEKAQGIACEFRFNIAERRLKGAKIGGFLILSGSKEDLAPVNQATAIFYVDSLDEYAAWLKEAGAEILHEPMENAFGRNLMARNPDGLVVEYFEPKAS